MGILARMTKVFRALEPDKTQYENHVMRSAVVFATKAMLLWVKLSLTSIIFDHLTNAFSILLAAQGILLGFSSVLPLATEPFLSVWVASRNGNPKRFFWGALF